MWGLKGEPGLIEVTIYYNIYRQTIDNKQFCKVIIEHYAC